MCKQAFQSIYRSWLDWKFSTKIVSALFNVILCTIAVLVVVNYITNHAQVEEELGSQFTILADQTVVRAGEEVEEGVKLLETLARTPSIIAAVKEANSKRDDWTEEFIAQQDKAWTDRDPEIQATLRGISENAISAYLIDFRNQNPEEAEVFITDQQGLNIAMTSQTSDFLQADEKWWASTFADRKGSKYFGAVEYDESSKAYAMTIGIPIMDPETNKAIGVMRGSLDISVLNDILGNVRIGQTGNVVLINSEGIVLYSHIPDQIMQPAPPDLFSLLTSGQHGWTQTLDMNGTSALVVFSSLGGDLGNALGWHLLITQQQAEIRSNVLHSLLISLLAGAVVAVIGTLVSALILSSSIAVPLGTLTKMAQELSVGNIVRDEGNSSNASLHLRRDEIGAISKAFDRLIVYFEGAAQASSAIAGNDLTISVAPNSGRDELGIAFSRMVEGLQRVIGRVAENAQAVSGAASQLAAASEQSGQATSQIAVTIQQVAQGTTQQSEEVNRTSSSVDQINRSIRDVAQGAREQAQAVNKASLVARQISSAIQQVTANAESGAQGANDAAEAARSGASQIEATIAGMQTIKNKVGLSAKKVHEMGQHSEQIDTIVDTINEIASQTNLLALNAAIEAARVETRGEKTVETLLQQHMLGAAGLVCELLASGRDLQSRDLELLAREARVADLFISDQDGLIVASSNPNSLGFRFSEDPRNQSYVFRSLLNQRDGVVMQPIQERDQDDKPFVFVGVSRRDRPGVIQAGVAADVVYNFVGYSRGFAVVADEIRKLAEHAKTSTKEIGTLISAIQKSVVEAVKVMEDGVDDVESRSAQATEAGKSLATILETVETVNQQVGEIAAAVQHMGNSSSELVSVMESVSSIVEQNIAATEEMTANSNQLTKAMENIASVSEENSAAVEEVSASTEEVSAQVEQVSASAAALMSMAQNLQYIVAQFKLNQAASNNS